jgi:hypothetical protein
VDDAGSFVAMRSRELDEAKWLELDTEGDDASVQLALWRFIDPSMHGPAKDIETALPSLLQELRDGTRLKATGHRNSADERTSIPVHFWRAARANLPDLNNGVQIAFWDRRGVWTDVLLKRHEVKRCWQMLGRGQRIPRRPTDAAVTDWYRERVANWPTDCAPPSANDDWEDAKDQLTLEPSRDQVAAIRREVAPPHWTKRGRRPAALRKLPEA